jgi:outer membrane protein assembly factor BamA
MKLLDEKLEFLEGGLYSRSILRDSLLKLRRLGYFSDVQIHSMKLRDAMIKLILLLS